MRYGYGYSVAGAATRGELDRQRAPGDGELTRYVDAPERRVRSPCERRDCRADGVQYRVPILGRSAGDSSHVRGGVDDAPLGSGVRTPSTTINAEHAKHAEDFFGKN